MRLKNELDDVSLAGLWRGFENYKLEFLRADCVAALSVALLSLPLSMAYALAAGLPPVVGIFATIFGTIFAAAFGSSRHLIIGPTNTVAILIQAAISQILFTYYREVPLLMKEALSLNIMIQLALIVGCLQLLAGLFKLGKLTQFVSRSVMIGYVIGAALAILVAQAPAFLGIRLEDVPLNTFGKIQHLLSHWTDIQVSTAVLAMSTLLFLILTQRVNRFLPSAVLMLGLSSIVVVALGLEGGQVVLVRDVGTIESILPKMGMPIFDLQIMSTLLPFAFAIALLGILEATTIARTIATQTGQLLATNQEIFSLGMTNLMGSFLGAMPCSGSFARSSLNYSSGAKTRLAALLSGLFVALLFYILNPVVLHIPLAALAALLFVSAFRMINFSELFVIMRASASDALVLILTCASCIFFTIDVGFYVGIVLSILCYLKQASTPHVKMKGDGNVRTLEVEGELFFAATDVLQTSVKAASQDDSVKVIVLHLEKAFHLDATACITLRHLNRYLKQTDTRLILSGLSRRAWQVICDSGLGEEIGMENLFTGEAVIDQGSTESNLKFSPSEGTVG